MPTPVTKSAAEYRELAKKLRLAAASSDLIETRAQLLLVAEDYEDLAQSLDLIERHAAN